jgi:hypothetical protein
MSGRLREILGTNLPAKMGEEGVTDDAVQDRDMVDLTSLAQGDTQIYKSWMRAEGVNEQASKEGFDRKLLNGFFLR